MFKSFQSFQSFLLVGLFMFGALATAMEPDPGEPNLGHEGITFGETINRNTCPYGDNTRDYDYFRFFVEQLSPITGTCDVTITMSSNTKTVDMHIGLYDGIHYSADKLAFKKGKGEVSLTYAVKSKTYSIRVGSRDPVYYSITLTRKNYTAPRIIAEPTATPNILAVNENVTFSIEIENIENKDFYVIWNFGNGVSKTGALNSTSITYAYPEKPKEYENMSIFMMKAVINYSATRHTWGKTTVWMPRNDLSDYDLTFARFYPEQRVMYHYFDAIAGNEYIIRSTGGDGGYIRLYTINNDIPNGSQNGNTPFSRAIAWECLTTGAYKIKATLSTNSYDTSKSAYAVGVKKTKRIQIPNEYTSYNVLAKAKLKDGPKAINKDSLLIKIPFAGNSIPNLSGLGDFSAFLTGNDAKYDLVGNNSRIGVKIGNTSIRVNKRGITIKIRKIDLREQFIMMSMPPRCERDRSSRTILSDFSAKDKGTFFCRIIATIGGEVLINQKIPIEYKVGRAGGVRGVATYGGSYWDFDMHSDGTDVIPDDPILLR